PTPAPTPTPTPVPGAPTINITTPADSATFAPGTNVTIVADARDSDGQIARVDFIRAPFDIDLGTDFNAPYTTTVTSGSPDVWNVYAVARDNAGNTTRSATIRIIWEDPNGSLSISGRIRHQQSSPQNEIFLPNARVELLLHSQLVKTTLTDSGGNYLFNNLSRGGEYTVRPAEPGYEFFPPSVIFSALTQDETWDFVASGPLPPGPTPTPVPGTGAVSWQKFYDGPQHQADYDPFVAIDSAGNTYVAATSGDATSGNTDIATIKYSPTGEKLWAVNFAGPGNYKDWANAIKVDSQGNAYVTGVSWEGSFAGSEYDAVTIKYDTNGNQQWVRYYNGPVGHWDRGEALALVRDDSGNTTGLVVAGHSQTSRAGGGLYDEFVTVRYDADGNQQWASRRSTAQLGDYANAVTVDAAANSYVSGFAYTSSSGSQTTKAFVIVKYSSTGDELWATTTNGVPSGSPGPQPLPNNPGDISPGNIALDAAGNLYVSGTNTPGATGSDFLLVKLVPATGAIVWSRNWAGDFNDYLRDMAIDATGNIFLTGESYDGNYYTATSQSTSDVATVKFDGAGTLVWSRIYRGFPGKWDGGRSVALDAVGNAYVGAASEGFVNDDTAVIKYTPDGTEAWVSRYDNPEHTDDNLNDMAVDGAGSIYLAGSAVLTNTAGAQTLDLVTARLTPST
ncbi:MAG: SBBP repeat-containing protein, partial [Pyrinomonadaceae bacterium]